MAFNDFKNGVSASGLSATPATFTLLGGLYAAGVVATFGGGNVALQILMPDGSTYLSIATYTQNALDIMSLPEGTYQMAITTATAVQFFVAPVPYRALV